MAKTKDTTFSSLLDISDSANRRRGINSVEIGVRVLECLISLGRPAPLKAVAEKAKLQPSQAHRYLASLVNSRVLRQDHATGLYDVGPVALRIGLYAITSNEALNDVVNLAQDISADERVATNVLVWGTSGPTVIRFFRGRPPLYSQVGMGTTFPVSGSVAGRVFMAYMREEEIEPYLSIEGFPGGVKKYPELMANITKIRSVGGDVGESPQIPGLRACAAPIFALGDVLVAVIAIPVPQAVTSERLASIFDTLIQRCRSITSDLGGQWPDVVE